jgi:hypothetical protein
MTPQERVKTYLRLKSSEDYIRYFEEGKILKYLTREAIDKYWHLVKCAYSELSGIDCANLPLDITIILVDSDKGDYEFKGEYTCNKQVLTINTCYAKDVYKTLIHELVHHLQHIVHPEYFKRYVLPKHSWNKYMYQSSEAEAHAISWYITEGIELNVFNDTHIFARLKLMCILDKIGAKFTWKDWIDTILNKSHK